MKDEYDFSGGVRGKFFRRDAHFVIPVDLEPDVLQFAKRSAEAKGISVDEFVNELLRVAAKASG